MLNKYYRILTYCVILESIKIINWVFCYILCIKLVDTSSMYHLYKLSYYTIIFSIERETKFCWVEAKYLILKIFWFIAKENNYFFTAGNQMKNLMPAILNHYEGRTSKQEEDTPEESLARAKNQYFNLYSKDLVKYLPISF